MSASVQQIGEGALERTLERLVQTSPEDAAELRAYFEENHEFFVRLSWAIVNRLLKRWAPRQAAEGAVMRMQEILIQDEPDSTEALARWFRENAEMLRGLAAHIAREAAPHVVAHAESGLSLLLRADPNPDFGSGTQEARAKIEPHWFAVESLSDAQELVDRFLSEYNLGSGNWTGGEVRKHGIPFARFSYNRRLWLRTQDGKDTSTELALDGNPIAPPQEPPLALAPSGTAARSIGTPPAQLTDWRLADRSSTRGVRADRDQAASGSPSAGSSVPVAPAVPSAPAEAPPSAMDLDAPRKQGHRWIERKVAESKKEADPSMWRKHASKRRAEAQGASNHGQAAFWEGVLEWLDARERGVPIVQDLEARQEEGRLWIADKLSGPLSIQRLLRWKFTAHEKYKAALMRSDASTAAFWEGVSRWIDAHPADGQPGPAVPSVSSRVPEAELGRERRAAKLRKLGESVAEQISSLRDSGTHNQRPTARRIRIIAGQEQAADRLERVRASLLALADAVENKCEPPSLQGLDLSEYRCLPESLEGVDSRALVEDLLTREKHPHPRVSTYYLNEALKLTEGASGLGLPRKTARRLITRCGTENWCLAQDFEEIKAVEDLSRAAEERATKPFDKSTMRDLRKDLAPYKRALSAGLTTQEAWTQARIDLQNLGKAREPRVDPLERQIRNEERALIGLDIPGYFPTPRDVVERMIVEAELSPGQRVLEPSAGKGSIADAIRAAGIEPDVIEIVPTLRALLKLKKHHLVAEDFLSFVGTYDRILMNPPFEQGQDMEHVRRAYRLLAPGGRIVAIMSAGPFFRTDKQAAEFRRWLEEVAADIAPLPEGSFLKSDRPTGVSTRLVVIDKPAYGPLVPSDSAASPVPLRPQSPTDPEEEQEKPETPMNPTSASAAAEEALSTATPADPQETPTAEPSVEAKQEIVPAEDGVAEAVEAAVSNAHGDAAELAKHGLRVRRAQTQPSRPGKKPRDIWIVEGDTAPYRMALRELGGKLFRGDITFWEDPTAELAHWLQENGRPSVEERRAHQQERSAARAERLEARALRKGAEADRAFSGARAIADGIPMGQPILVGHHSEARHRRDVDRMHRRMDRGVAAHREATELHAKAEAAAENAQPRRSRTYLHNRIEEARANLADVKRKLARPGLSEASKAQLGVYLRDYEDQLAYWSAEMDKAGGVPFGPDNVRAGDQVRYGGTWYPVVRANEKTVTIGNWLGSPRLTWKAPWASVQAHEPADAWREQAGATARAEASPEEGAAPEPPGAPPQDVHASTSLEGPFKRASALDGLDPEQRAAAETDGYVLVAAGAGSGKTHTLVSRVIYLVRERAVSPETILLLAFNRRAAREIGERLSATLSEAEAKQITLGTMHSVFGRWVTEHGGKREREALTKYLLAGDGGAKRGPRPATIFGHMARIWQECRRDLPPRSATNQIQSWAGRGLAASLAANEALGEHERRVALWYEWYEGFKGALDHDRSRWTPDCDSDSGRRLWQQFLDRFREGGTARLGDFTDMITLCKRLLDGNQPLVQRLQARYSHILVDEAQDLNPIQHDILTRLSSHIDGKKGQSVWMVGDEKQSINYFVGARPELFTELAKGPGWVVRTITTNYRCAPEIIDVANQLMRHHPLALPMESQPAPTRARGRAEVALHRPRTHVEGAQQMLTRIRHHIDRGASPSDFAVLARTNLELAAYETACIVQRVPYTRRNSTSFLRTPEASAVMGYLTLAAGQPRERLIGALADILDTPTRLFLRAGQAQEVVHGAVRRYAARNGKAVEAVDPLWLLAEPDFTSLLAELKGLPTWQAWRDREAREELDHLARTLRQMRQAVLHPAPSARYPSRQLVLDILQVEGAAPRPGASRTRLREVLVPLAQTEEDAAEPEGEESDAGLGNVEFFLMLADGTGERGERLSDPAALAAHMVSLEARAADLRYDAAKWEADESRKPPAERRPVPAVTLSTVHAVKGAQWRDVTVVVAAGVFPMERRAEEEARTPQQQAQLRKRLEEEFRTERQLAYVAFTRAAERLHILAPAQTAYGKPAGLSQFLHEAGLAPSEAPKERSQEPAVRGASPVSSEEMRTGACPPSNPACGLGLVGGTCTIPASLMIPAAHGAPHEQVARFCLAEASQLIPSHDPTRGFTPRAEYPAEVQERRYERDQGEQMKVIQIAQNLRPELIFNAAPGAIDGPPVVTEQGYVLGGNGRTMGLQLHYQQGGTAARSYLLEHAHEFGFTREQVAARRQPVIVRVVPTDGSKRQLQELVRILNVPLTQALDVRSESVAEARRLSEEALSVLAAAFEGDETLGAYLSSRASKPFTEALRRSGILTDRNTSRFLTPLETYTDDGKVFVERLLTAALLPEATLLDQLGTEARQTLARGAPWVLTAASYGGAAWDLRPVLRAAAQDWVRMRATGQRSVDEHLRQEGMFADSQPAVKAFTLGAKVLRVFGELVSKPVKFTLFARTYAGYARQHPEGQSALFPTEVLSPADALARAATAAGVPSGS